MFCTTLCKTAWLPQGNPPLVVVTGLIRALVSTQVSGSWGLDPHLSVGHGRWSLSAYLIVR